MIKYLKEESSFKKETEKEEILVDFFATWCGPCKMLNLTLENYEKEDKDFEILKVDIDEFPEIAKEYGIMSVPTLMLFKKGQIIKKEPGFKSIDEFKKMIEK